MAEVNGCVIPEEVYLWVDKHVWARPDGEEVVIGMTDPAQKMAGKILYVQPKKPGKSVSRGQSVGTVECAKYVGPVPTPVSGDITAGNDALRVSGAAVNADPYGEGWVVRIKPTNLAAELAELVTGADGVEAYRRKLEADDIRCRG